MCCAYQSYLISTTTQRGLATRDDEMFLGGQSEATTPFSRQDELEGGTPQRGNRTTPRMIIIPVPIL